MRTILLFLSFIGIAIVGFAMEEEQKGQESGTALVRPSQKADRQVTLGDRFRSALGLGCLGGMRQCCGVCTRAICGCILRRLSQWCCGKPHFRCDADGGAATATCCLAALGFAATRGPLVTTQPSRQKDGLLLRKFVQEESVDITPLAPYYPFGIRDYPVWPFPPAYDREFMPALRVTRATPLAGDNLNLIKRGIYHLILDFPLNLEPLVALGAEGETYGPYMITITGKFTKADLRAFQDLLERWQENGIASCSHLNFCMVRGIKKTDLFKGVGALYHRICITDQPTHLGFSFLSLNDSDLLNLYKALRGRAPNLEGLYLPFNEITSVSLNNGSCQRGWFCSDGGLFSLAGNFSKLKNISIEGNPVDRIPDAFNQRLQIVQVTLNSENNGTEAKFMRGLGRKHPKILEEDRSIAVLAKAFFPFGYTLAFSLQSLEVLTLSGAGLPFGRVMTLLRHMNPKAVKKLSLDGAVQEGRETPENHQEFIELLKQFAGLVSLDLGGILAEQGDLVGLYGGLLSFMQNLVYFGFSRNQLETETLYQFLGNVQSYSKKLRALDVSWNKLTDTALPLLKDSRLPDSLEYLNLSGDQFELQSETEALMKFLVGEDKSSFVNPLVVLMVGNPILGERVRFLKSTLDSRKFTLVIDGVVDQGAGTRGDVCVLGNPHYYHQWGAKVYNDEAFPLVMLNQLLEIPLRGQVKGLQDMRVILRTLQGVRGADLSYNPRLEYDDQFTMRDFLKWNSITLQSLNLAGMKWITNGIGLLIEGLGSLSNLKDLNLGGNNLRGNLKFFEAALKGKPLEALNLSNNGLGSGDAKSLERLLPTLSKLRELNLSSNRFRWDESRISSALGKLWGAQAATVVQGGVVVMPPAPTTSPTSGGGYDTASPREVTESIDIVSVDVKREVFDTDGLKPYAAVMMEDAVPGLRVLDLSNCSLSNLGMLAQGISQHTTLTSLNLRGNGIGDKQGQSLAVLKRLPRLERFEAAGNSFRRKTANTLADALSMLPNLTVVDLHGQGWGTTGTVVLGPYFESQRQIHVKL